MTTTTTTRTWTALALVLTTGAGLTGCATAESGSADTSPAKVMVAGTFTGAGPFPMQPPMIDAVFTRLNEAGGVNGHRIEWTLCDDQRDANKAAQCARQAVEEGAVAYLSLQSNFGDTILPLLDAAGIPYLRSIATQQIELSSPNSFPSLAGTIAAGGAIGIAMAKDGCTRPTAVATDAASSQFVVKASELGLAASHGAQPLAHTTVANGYPDFTPIVAAFAAQGVDCVGSTLLPPDQLKLMQSIAQSGAKIRVYGIAALFPPSVVDALKGTVDLTFVSDFPVLDDPALTELDPYRADAKAAGIELEGNGAQAWYLADLFRQALERVDGPVTAASVTEALERTAELRLPAAGSIDLTTPFEVAKYPRMFNRSMHVQRVKGTKVVEVDEPYDVSDFMALLATSS
jgi:ABC-type branched-subunit amino acid transport system substrate-binding protein